MSLAYDVNILRSIAFKMLHVPKKTSLINSYFKKAKIKTKANKQKLKTIMGLRAYISTLDAPILSLL